MSESGQDLGLMQKRWLDAVSASTSIETLEQVRAQLNEAMQLLRL